MDPIRASLRQNLRFSALVVGRLGPLAYVLLTRISYDVPKFLDTDKVVLSGIAGGIDGCVVCPTFLLPNRSYSILADLQVKTVVALFNCVKILFQASNLDIRNIQVCRDDIDLIHRATILCCRG
jgi:hypothetical protein